MSIAAIEYRSLRAQLGGLTASRNSTRDRLEEARRTADPVLINYYEIELQRINSRIDDVRYRMELRKPPEEEEVPPPPPTPPPKRYTLTVDIMGDGYIIRSPDLDSYDPWAGVYLTAMPNDGWSFKEWGGDISATTRVIHVTMNEDKEITAEFTQIGYTGVQYTKYYTYLPQDGAGYKERHFEARGYFTIPVKTDPSDESVLNYIEALLNDIMIDKLGIRVNDRGWDHELTLGEESTRSFVKTFESHVPVTITDLTRRLTHRYKYTEYTSVSEKRLKE